MLKKLKLHFSCVKSFNIIFEETYKMSLTETFRHKNKEHIQFVLRDDQKTTLETNVKTSLWFLELLSDQHMYPSAQHFLATWQMESPFVMK